MIYATKLFDSEFIAEHYFELKSFLDDKTNQEKINSDFIFGTFEEDLNTITDLHKVCFTVNSLKLIDEGLVISIKPTSNETGKRLEHILAKEDRPLILKCDIVNKDSGIDLVFYCK